MNILIQWLFPLSLSFAPAIAASSSNSSAMVAATEPYIVGTGDNVATIAKKYDIPVKELKKSIIIGTAPNLYRINRWG